MNEKKLDHAMRGEELQQLYQLYFWSGLFFSSRVLSIIIS